MKIPPQRAGLILALIIVSSGALANAQTAPTSAPTVAGYNTTFWNATLNRDPNAFVSAFSLAQASNTFGNLNQGLKAAYNYLDIFTRTSRPQQFLFAYFFGQAAAQDPNVFVRGAISATSGLSNYSIRADANNPNSTVDLYAKAIYQVSNQTTPAVRSLLVAVSGIDCGAVTLIFNYAYNDYPDAASRIAQFDDAATGPIIQCFRNGGPDLNPSFGSGIRYQGTFVEGFYRARARIPAAAPAQQLPTLATGRRMLDA